LAAGRLEASDHFLREGQTDWLPLTEFGRSINSALSGEANCRVQPDTIELRGMRHWPTAARAGLWIVAWILLAVAFSALGPAMPDEAAGLATNLLLGAWGHLMASLGAPFLAAMLTHYSALRPAACRWPNRN
jgi:hypothetical protein